MYSEMHFSGLNITLEEELKFATTPSVADLVLLP